MKIIASRQKIYNNSSSTRCARPEGHNKPLLTVYYLARGTASPTPLIMQSVDGGGRDNARAHTGSGSIQICCTSDTLHETRPPRASLQNKLRAPRCMCSSEHHRKKREARTCVSTANPQLLRWPPKEGIHVWSYHFFSLFAPSPPPVPLHLPGHNILPSFVLASFT